MVYEFSYPEIQAAQDSAADGSELARLSDVGCPAVPFGGAKGGRPSLSGGLQSRHEVKVGIEAVLQAWLGIDPVPSNRL